MARHPVQPAQLGRGEERRERGPVVLPAAAGRSRPPRRRTTRRRGAGSAPRTCRWPWLPPLRAISRELRLWALRGPSRPAAKSSPPAAPGTMLGRWSVHRCSGRPAVRRERGAGPPIVLIHAAIANLRRLGRDGARARGRRLPRRPLRLPGFGASTTEDVEFSNGADLLAVLDAFGVARAALVGNSRGGPDRLRHRHRVPRASGRGRRRRGRPGRLRGRADRGGAGPVRGRRALSRRPRNRTSRRWSTWRCGSGWTVRASRRTGSTPGIREAVRAMDRPLYEPGRARAGRSRLDPPANDRLGELRCPVLAVAGALDISDVVAGGAPPRGRRARSPGPWSGRTWPT